MEAWTVTSPSGFSIGKNTVYPGETVTCTWNPSTGDFDSYCLEAFEQGDFIITSEKQSFTVSKAATSYAVTIPENATVGNHIQFVIQAQKGAEGASKPVGVYPEIVSNSPETLPAPGFITVSDAIHGSEVTIRWGAVSIAAPYSGGYTVQRSVNGGPFGEETEDGMNNTFHTNKTELTQTVGEDWNTVQYRVRALRNSNSSEFVFSDWTTSAAVPVLSGITLPPGGRLTQLENRNAKPVFPLTVTEGVFRQRDGKSLERVLAEMELGVTGPAGAAGPGVPTGGAAGQLLAKRSSGDYDTEWVDAPSSGGTTEPGTGGVTSFKGRTGAVTPQSGDYTADQVGAVPTSRKVNGQALSSDITLITCGTADLTAGSSPLAAGTLYGVYEV